MSEPSARARGRRADARILANTAVEQLARSCMSEPSARARGRRACVPYCRTALYGFPSSPWQPLTLLDWRREMRSEGVGNMPNRQTFLGSEDIIMSTKFSTPPTNGPPKDQCPFPPPRPRLPSRLIHTVRLLIIEGSFLLTHCHQKCV